MSLESRVDKLEDDIKELAPIPSQLLTLIDAVKETNKNIKELSHNMSNNYVTKETLSLTIANENATIKLWVITACISGFAGLGSWLCSLLGVVR